MGANSEILIKYGEEADLAEIVDEFLTEGLLFEVENNAQIFAFESLQKVTGKPIIMTWKNIEVFESVNEDFNRGLQKSSSKEFLEHIQVPALKDSGNSKFLLYQLSFSQRMCLKLLRMGCINMTQERIQPVLKDLERKFKEEVEGLEKKK